MHYPDDEETQFLHDAKKLEQNIRNIRELIVTFPNINGKGELEKKLAKSEARLNNLLEEKMSKWMNEDKHNCSAFWVPFAISVLLIFILCFGIKAGMDVAYKLGQKDGVHDEKIGWLEDQVLQIKEELNERR